ncbi:hypothetical protein C2U69_33225 [Cupriavidus pinatubonensis]|nr:hypothetical protein C2U69_33225 [Cupriavidus pinatubonensis]
MFEFSPEYEQQKRDGNQRCRTGTGSATLWALSQSARRPLPDIIERAAAAGYDLKGVVRRIANGGRT